MKEISSSVQGVTSLMGIISAASRDQRQGIEQMNQTVAQLDDVTKQNAAMVEESAAVAEGLEEQSAILAQSVSIFKLKDSRGASTNVKVLANQVALPMQ